MNKKYVVNRTILTRCRARLTLKLDRDIEWPEFAEMMGLSYAAIRNIRQGRTGGSTYSMNKIMAGMKEHGLIMHLADFERITE